MIASFNSAKDRLEYNPKPNGYMGISLESRNHTGDRLEGIVAWINRFSRFERIRIGLSDTLNRFNYEAEDMSPEEAKAKALSVGDAWLEKNQRILDKLDIPVELYRWDHWENNNPVRVALNRVRFAEAAINHPEFSKAINEDIYKYSTRRYGEDYTPTKALWDRCAQYLIEELAVYEEIYRDYPNTTIYPGKQLKCFEVLRDGTVTGLSQTIPQTDFLRLKLPHNIPEMERVMKRERHPADLKDYWREHINGPKEQEPSRFRTLSPRTYRDYDPSR